MVRLKIIGVHLLVFLIIEIVFLYSSEYILDYFLSGTHNVATWDYLNLIGVFCLFVICVISSINYILKIKN